MERNTVWFQRFPAALVAYDQWVLWKYEQRGDKLTKVPYQITGGRASSTDRTTWSSLDAVKRARWSHAGEYDGVGFVFSAEDPFVGIDLDHARGEGWAMELIDQFPTYYEITPSWTGYHLIGVGTLPDGKGHRKGPIEVYDRGRYFTMTGVWGPGSPLDVAPIQAPLDSLLESLRPVVAPPRTPAPARSYHPHDALRKLLLARNGSKAQRLYAGDSSLHGGDESVADLAFLEQLCWYTRDPATLDTIFRESGRMRPKWDARHGAQTYGEMTIQAALLRADG